MFTFISVSFSSLLQLDGLSATLSWPVNHIPWLYSFSALIPAVTLVPNFAFANSFSEAPNTLLHVQISNLPVQNIITKWDSPVCKAEKPQAMYELSHKGCHKREPGVSFCIWVVLYVFFSQTIPYIQLALEILQAWDPPFPTGNLSFCSL